MHSTHWTCRTQLGNIALRELYASHDRGAHWASSPDSGCSIVLLIEPISSLGSSQYTLTEEESLSCFLRLRDPKSDLKSEIVCKPVVYTSVFLWLQKSLGIDPPITVILDSCLVPGRHSLVIDLSLNR